LEKVFKSKTILLITMGIIFGIFIGIAVTKFVNKSSEPNVAQSSNLAKLTSSADNNINYDNTAKSVVPVIARFGSLNNQRFGCGVVYDDSGYVITNRHIVENLKKAYIYSSGKEIEAKIIGSNKDLDIAVLKVDENLPQATFGDSSKIKLGQRIYVIGKPFMKKTGYMLTSGIISTLPINFPKGWPSLLAVDAVVNPGNSGGPVVNEDGNVIAITTAYQSSGFQTQGLGFAIPINEVLKVVKEIISD
jgi:serine protease Do